LNHPSISAVVLAFLAGIAAPSGSWAQDVEAGEKTFNKCKSCDQVGENAKNRIGPTLNGIVGQPAGLVEGFRYSDALLDGGDALLDGGIVWNEPTLAAYLANPRTAVPESRMSFAGLRNDEEIANVIAYLATYAADGTQ